MNPTVAMRHLLWKDFRQIRPALVACLVMLACIQLLYLAAQLVERGTSMATFQSAYLIALIAPTLAAIACSGLLVGQERQTRTWNWSSSLPISWSSALASKFVVWLASSAVLTVLLLAVYGLLYRVALLAGRVPSSDVMWQIAEVRVMLAMLLLIPFEVFVIFSIAALLWNDTLLALVVSAIALVTGHLLVIDVGTRIVHGIPRSYPLRPQDYLETVVALLVAAIALAALGLCYAFRWRWTTGQLSSVSLRDFIGSRFGKRVGGSSLAYASGDSRFALPNALARSLGRPSETVMLFVHALRSGLGVRLTVVTAALAMLAIVPNDWQIFPPVLLVASVLLGASAFGHEHSFGRYRFFADRGASGIRFLVAHGIVGLIWLLGLFLAAYCLLRLRRASLPTPALDFADPNLFGIVMCAFGLGVFSSLCITNSVIATTLAGLILFASAVSYQIADSFYGMFIAESGHVLAAVPLTVVIMLVGLVYQSRRWFLLDRPHSLRTLVTSWLIGLIVPIWLCMTFGYLLIPAVEWQGLPESQLKPTDQARLPEFKSEMPDLAGMIGQPSSPVVASGVIIDNFRNQLQRFEQHLQSVPAWLDARKVALEQLSAELSDPASFTPVDLNGLRVLQYSKWIEQTAFTGVAATKARDLERALLAWKLNHSLLELGEDDADLASRTLLARTVTWGLWNLLEDDDLAFLRQGSELNLLTPGHVDTAIWTYTIRARWTVRRLSLRSGGLPNWPPSQAMLETSILRPALNYYPPLRWAVERQMALQLNRELNLLSGREALPAQANGTWMATYDPIVNQIQRLRQFEREVTTKLSQTQ